MSDYHDGSLTHALGPMMTVVGLLSTDIVL